MAIGILYVDDHEVFHECVRTLINIQPEMEIIGFAGNGRVAVEKTRELKPDVVIMDIALPVLNGIDATRKIVAENPLVKVLALSSFTDRRNVVEMLQAGARGYVVKEGAFDELLQAIKAVGAGKMYLSPSITNKVIDDYLALTGDEHEQAEDLLSSREREILQLVAEGHTSRDIADQLRVSLKTVETHRANLMKKLHLTTLADLVKYAIREGLVSL